MSRMDELVARRCQVVQELGQLEQIRRGSVVEQFVERTLKDGTKVRRGPYVLYSFKQNGKTVSRRLPNNEDEVHMYREQIAGFRRFRELTVELLELGEELSELAVKGDAETLKKTSRLKLNRTGM